MGGSGATQAQGSVSGGPRRGTAHKEAELRGPREFVKEEAENLRFRTGFMHLGLTVSGTVPTNRRTTIPNDSGPISWCFDDDPKLFNCEIAQPRQGGGPQCKERRFLLYVAQ